MILLLVHVHRHIGEEPTLAVRTLVQGFPRVGRGNVFLQRHQPRKLLATLIARVSLALRAVPLFHVFLQREQIVRNVTTVVTLVRSFRSMAVHVALPVLGVFDQFVTDGTLLLHLVRREFVPFAMIGEIRFSVEPFRTILTNVVDSPLMNRVYVRLQPGLRSEALVAGFTFSVLVIQRFVFCHVDIQDLLLGKAFRTPLAPEYRLVFVRMVVLFVPIVGDLRFKLSIANITFEQFGIEHHLHMLVEEGSRPKLFVTTRDVLLVVNVDLMLPDGKEIIKSLEAFLTDVSLVLFDEIILHFPLLRWNYHPFPDGLDFFGVFHRRSSFCGFTSFSKFWTSTCVGFYFRLAFYHLKRSVLGILAVLLWLFDSIGFLFDQNRFQSLLVKPFHVLVELMELVHTFPAGLTDDRIS